MSRDPDAPFSRRFGYCRDLDVEITIREDAPEWFRDWLQPASEDAGMNAVELRQVTRRLLPEMPEFRNVFPKLEASAALNRCEWYLVYDVAEAIYAALRRRQVRPEGPATVFEERLNKLFRERGVGWQMRNGRMEFRGSELFNVVTREASEVLAGHGRQTAAREIHEPLRTCPAAPSRT